MARAYDTITPELAEKLRKLKTLLETPIVARVVGLNESSSTDHQFNHVVRLLKSLEQYQEKDRTLLYVGFVGHYSSGKSSTINSILNLWATPEARMTGHQPTDHDITLITHQKNEHDLLKTKEGNVAIRSRFVSHELLNNIVIADTPGSGDPETFEEIVRDCLPICDLIFYFINAPNPIDNADIPLLALQQKELPFIPRTFLITRADEFRINADLPISTSNYDSTAEAVFIEQTADRVGKLVPGILEDHHNFIAVDNRKSFNIDKPRSLLLKLISEEEPERIIGLHAHKVDFFRRKAAELHAYFVNVVNEKQQIFNRLIESTKVNYISYEKTVEISNNRLIPNWTETSRSIGKEFEELALKLNRMTDILGKFGKWENSSRFRKWSETSDELLTNASRLLAKTESLYLSHKLSNQIQEYFTGLLLLVEKNSRSLDSLDMAADFNEFSFSFPKEFIDAVIGGELIDHSDRATLELVAETNELRGELGQAINSHKSRLTARVPLVQCNEHIRILKEKIIGDIHSCFDKAQIYSAAVLTLRQNELVNKIGISAELDGIQKPITEEYKDEVNAEVERDLFSSYVDFAENFASTCEALYSGFQDQVRRFNDERPDSAGVPSLNSRIHGEQTRKIGWPDSAKKAVNDSEIALNNDIHELGNQYVNMLRAGRDDFLRGVEKFKKNTLFVTFWIGLLAGTASYLLYARHLLNATPALGNFDNFLFSVVASVVASGICWSLIKLSRIREGWAYRSKARIAAEIAGAFKVKVNNLLATYREICVEPEHMEQSIKSMLQMHVKDILDGKPNSLRKEEYGYLQNIAEGAINSINRYKAASQKFYTQLQGNQFSDLDKVLKVLESTATLIRGHAMEPSFQCLESIGEKLSGVSR